MRAVAEGEPDEAAVRQFVEDFAATMTASGVPRMPARVFGCLLLSRDGRLTAAELAERLQVSPAAISGAIQYLDTVHLVRRTREPGGRRDQYVVEHDVWYQATFSQNDLLRRWIDQLGDGLALVGEQSAAGARLSETRDFFIFLIDELDQMRRRWAERQRLRSTAS
jgi:DNA-binding transcriptional regulator GbsR (MarR family)